MSSVTTCIMSMIDSRQNSSCNNPRLQKLNLYFSTFSSDYILKEENSDLIENNLKRILLKDNNLNLYHKYYIHLPKIRQFH